MLDADRERAGLNYERLRARLTKFFEWRDCDNPEELADIVFDRIVKKITLGEQINNINAYSATVAQFVLKEAYRGHERDAGSIDDHPEIGDRPVLEDVDEDADARMACLEKCLAGFSSENRSLIVAYHDTDERTMIAARKRIANAMGISLNTLRIRVCRLKAKLEECTLACCEA